MKILKIVALGIMMLFASNSMTAQVSVNVNLGVQPSWGPVGYESVDYYYLPDVESYYDVRNTQFIYLNSGHWVRSKYLPRQYRNYDLNHGYKVVLNNYRGSRPYTSFKSHKIKYYKGYKGAPQRSIGYRESNHKHYDNHRDYDKHGKKGNKGHSKEKGKH